MLCFHCYFEEKQVETQNIRIDNTHGVMFEAICHFVSDFGVIHERVKHQALQYGQV